MSTLENPFLLPPLNDGQTVYPESHHRDASALAARFINARANADLDLESEIECDISVFVCHMAREVAEGETHEAVLGFYADRFSDLITSGKA